MKQRAGTLRYLGPPRPGPLHHRPAGAHGASRSRSLKLTVVRRNWAGQHRWSHYRQATGRNGEHVTAAKRRSTHLTMRSRIISPDIPAVVATQAITSRSWQSRANATRTISPFQQVNSSPSEHQRMFDRRVTTLPSCSRGRRRPVWRVSSSPMLLHQPIDALGIDRSAAGGSPLALNERGDPPVSIGWSGIDEAANLGGEFGIAVTGLRPPLVACAFDAFGDIGSSNAKRGGDHLHREVSRVAELDSEIAYGMARPYPPQRKLFGQPERKGSTASMEIAVLGIDLGKNSCSLVGLDRSGAVVKRRRMRPESIAGLHGTLPACVVAMEACCGAHHLGRLLRSSGTRRSG